LRVPDFIYKQLLCDRSLGPEDVTVYLAAQLHQTSTVEEVAQKANLSKRVARRICDHLCQAGWMFNATKEGPQAALLAKKSTESPDFRPVARASDTCQAILAQRFLDMYSSASLEMRGRLLMCTLFELVVNADELVDFPSIQEARHGRWGIQ
jgi:DNA-binding IscR family transcriptional regulator